MALPNNNITISMVRNELGESSNDLSVLCRSDNINKWSKWKPTLSGIDSMTTAELINSKYSIAPPTQYASPLALYTALSNGTTFYNYNKPTMCRLGDFRNYERTALLPILSGIKESDNITIAKSPATPLSHFAIDEPTDSSTTIGKDGIEVINSTTLYFCVIFKINNTYYYTSKSGGVAWDWSSIGHASTNGSATMILCYLNKDLNNIIMSSVPDNTYKFIPIPTDNDNVSLKNVTLTTQATNIDFTITLYATDNSTGIINVSVLFDAYQKYGGDTYEVKVSYYNGHPNGGQLLTTQTLTSGINIGAGNSHTFTTSYNYNQSAYQDVKWVTLMRNNVVIDTQQCDSHSGM